MKKFIVGFIAIIFAGIIIASFPLSKKEIDLSATNDSILNGSFDDSDYFSIETLSQKGNYMVT